MKKKIKIEVEPQFRKPADDPRMFREAELTVETRKDENGEAKTTVRVSVSSEAPYLRRYLYDAEQDAWV